MSIQTCCFTGRRPQSFSWKYNEGDLRCILLKFRLKREIVRAIKQDCIQHFLTGMALGVDTWAAEIVLSLRKRWHVTLECVLPCHDQDARWPQESRERYQSILAQCDKVTLLQTHYSPDCFDKRNRYLIDHSDLVIAVWNGSPSVRKESINRREVPALLEGPGAETPRPPDRLPVFLGLDERGRAVEWDMVRLRHLLIAGGADTGVGEYPGALLQPLLRQASPQEVQLVLMTTPGGDLLRYDGDPHLLLPAITNPQTGVRVLQQTVRKLGQRQRHSASGSGVQEGPNKRPRTLVVVEELAALMEAGGKKTERAICQIARRGYPAGIHLILATRHPSPETITGLIKVDITSRVAFAVDSIGKSRIILDIMGAEQLGEGELLAWPLGTDRPILLRKGTP